MPRSVPGESAAAPRIGAALVDDPESPEYREAIELRVSRFGAKSTLGYEGGFANLPTAHGGMAHSHLAVARALAPIRRGAAELPAGSVVGTMSVTGSGAMAIEEFCLFAPGSLGAAMLRSQTAFELGGLAMHSLGALDFVDALDGMAGVLLAATLRFGKSHLVMLSRRTMVARLKAEVPGLLRPFRIEQSLGAVEWNERSAELQHLRVLYPRGWFEPHWPPDVWVVTAADLLADLEERRAQRPARWEHPDRFEDAFGHAVRRALRPMREPGDDAAAARTAPRSRMHGAAAALGACAGRAQPERAGGQGGIEDA
jgi:hypothetical protein